MDTLGSKIQQFSDSGPEEPPRKHSYRLHEAASRSDAKAGSSRSGARRVYFLVAGLWGFLLGWSALPLGLTLSGSPPAISRGPVLGVTGILLALALAGTFLLNSSYSEYRRHRRR